MVVRDAYCIASRQWFSIGVDRTDCIYKVWFHCESKCLSPDDTVEKMQHRAVFPQCELLKYLLRCPTWLNDFSHHRLSPLWESMWIFRLLYLLRFPAWLNELMHSEHLCDFSPLWITSLIKWFVTFGAGVRLFPCVNEQMSSRISSLTIKLLFAFCAFVRLLFLFLASPYGRLGG